MKRKPALIGAITVALLGLTAGTIPASSAERETQRVLNVAHRGASARAPEHTLAAYDLAIKMGADFIEQDLQMSSDGVLVVLHDESLERTARGPTQNCTGLVRDKTLEQLKTCDVGTWFNETYPERARSRYEGLKIPTLDEVFDRYGHQINYYIETKTPALYPGMEQELLDTMDEHGLIEPAQKKWRVLIQSFFPQSLETVHALNPNLPLIQLYPGLGTSNVEQSLDHASSYAVGIGPTQGDVDEELVESAHARCLGVHPYTVDSRADMKAVISAGVDGMFTNRPSRLEVLLGRNSLTRPLRAKAAEAQTWRSCKKQ